MTFDTHLATDKHARDTFLALNIPQRINARKRWNILHPSKEPKATKPKQYSI